MLILPAKRALNTKDPDVIIATLRALQQLVQAGEYRTGPRIRHPDRVMASFREAGRGSVFGGQSNDCFRAFSFTEYLPLFQ